MNKLSEDLDFILREAKASFDQLKGKSIFITGGTGFFGKWLLEAFIWANDKKKYQIDVTVLSRNPEKFKKDFPHLCTGINFHAGDIESFDFIDDKFDYIIHAATTASPTRNREFPKEVYQNILNGTKRILDFSKHVNAKRILNTSSGAVYGKQPYDIDFISETYLDDPSAGSKDGSYGQGKRESELMGLQFAKNSGIDFINARCFAFAGPYLPLDGDYAFGNFIRNCIKGEDIEIKGDGTPLRSYLYAADLVIWLLRLLTHGKSGESYNVGSSEIVSIQELSEKMIEDFPDVKVNIHEEHVTGTPIERYVPNVDKIKNELSLSDNFNLTEIIKKTLPCARSM